MEIERGEICNTSGMQRRKKKWLHKTKLPLQSCVFFTPGELLICVNTLKEKRIHKLLIINQDDVNHNEKQHSLPFLQTIEPMPQTDELTTTVQCIINMCCQQIEKKNCIPPYSSQSQVCYEIIPIHIHFATNILHTKHQQKFSIELLLPLVTEKKHAVTRNDPKMQSLVINYPY